MGSTARTALDQEKPASSKTTSRMTQWTALLKVVLWPMVVLIIYFQLHGPITRVFEELPKVVSRSSKVSFGSFSLEIQSSLSVSGDQALADNLGGISEKGFEALMDLKASSRYWVGMSDDRRDIWIPTEETLNAWRELRGKNLAEFSQDESEFQKALNVLPFHKELKPGGTYHSPRALTAGEVDALERQSVKLSSEGEKAGAAAVRVVIKQLADHPNSQEKH